MLYSEHVCVIFVHIHALPYLPVFDSVWLFHHLSLYLMYVCAPVCGCMHVGVCPWEVLG